MDKIIGGLAGAGGAANTAGGYYTGAANDIYNLYGPSSTQQFVRLQNEALKPQFNAQDQQMWADMAAKGMTSSGAGKFNFGNLGAQQSAQIAGADAPLFSQGLGAAAGVYSQMPGAQSQAYQDAIAQFYQALSVAGQAAGGMPPNAGSSPYAGPIPAGNTYGAYSGYNQPGDSGGVSNTPYLGP